MRPENRPHLFLLEGIIVAKNSGKTAQTSQKSVADAAIDKADEKPVNMSWAQMDGPVGQELHPATISKEQAAILDMREQQNDAEREEFMALNDGNFLGGQRQIVSDQLARILDCTSYISRATKPWSKDYKGNVIEVMFDREYPQRRIMVDDFGYAPDAKVIEDRRRMCAEHGYIYLCGTPAEFLTAERLEKQSAASKKLMREIVESRQKKPSKKSTED